MSSIKVLRLPAYWNSSWIRQKLALFPSMPPIFKREGWYYNRIQKKSWIEINIQGNWLAYLDKTPESFLNQLRILDCQLLTTELSNSIKQVLQQIGFRKIPALTRLYNQDKYVKELHNIGRSTKLHLHKFRRDQNESKTNCH
jgi:hypothetical protein